MADTNKGIVLAGPGRRAIVCGRLVRRAWSGDRWDDRPAADPEPYRRRPLRRLI